MALFTDLCRQVSTQGGTADDEALGALDSLQGVIHRVHLQIEGLDTNASLSDASADSLCHACCVAVCTGIQDRHAALLCMLYLLHSPFPAGLRQPCSGCSDGVWISGYQYKGWEGEQVHMCNEHDAREDGKVCADEGGRLNFAKGLSVHVPCALGKTCTLKRGQ